MCIFLDRQDTTLMVTQQQQDGGQQLHHQTHGGVATIATMAGSSTITAPLPLPSPAPAHQNYQMHHNFHPNMMNVWIQPQ